jgi:hypothetical protein
MGGKTCYATDILADQRTKLLPHYCHPERGTGTPRAALTTIAADRSRNPKVAPLVCAGRRSRWRRYGGSCRRRTVIHQVLQFLTGLKKWDLLGRNFDAITCFRIPPHPRFALSCAKAAKSAYFDFVTHPQRAHYAVKDRIHNHFAVFTGKFRQPGNFFNQVSLRHKPLLLPLGTDSPFGPLCLRGVSIQPLHDVCL